MHASLHQLLSLRDEVIVHGALAAHVNRCSECRAELERLRSVTAQLRALPAPGAAPEKWEDIDLMLRLEEGMPPHPDRLPLAGERRKERKPGWRWPLAAAAAVLCTVTVLSWKGSDAPAPQTGERPMKVEQTPEETAEAARLALVAQSRRLEQVLSVLPREPLATRASTALTLAELQDRIRWVDYRLALGERAAIEPQQSELLWRERVDLLNSLVAVRYAQARVPL